MPTFITPDCYDLLKRLLQRNPHDRIGAIGGIEEIKQHPWFKDISWEDVGRKMMYAKKYEPKQLKMKQDRIDMKDLTGPNRHRYKERELISVKDWSFNNFR